MIQCEQINMPEVEEAKLREWLEKPQLDSLKRHVKAEVKSFQVEAANHAMTARDHAGYYGAANETIQKAYKLEIFLEVLESIVKHEAPFTLVKLT